MSFKVEYTVKVFALLQERIGQETWRYQSDARITSLDLIKAFFDHHPGLETLRMVTRLAVNRVFCTQDVLLNPDDELALIPPVSGG